MHYSLVILLALGLSVSGFVTPNSERRCVEGKSYFDGCNSCRCANPNIGPVCTMKMCHVMDEQTRDYKPYTPQDPPADFWQP